MEFVNSSQQRDYMLGILVLVASPANDCMVPTHYILKYLFGAL